MIAAHHTWHTVRPGKHEGGSHLEQSRVEVVNVDTKLTGVTSLQVMAVDHHQSIVTCHHAPGLTKILDIFHRIVTTNNIGNITVIVELDGSAKFGVVGRFDATTAVVDHFVVDKWSAGGREQKEGVSVDCFHPNWFISISFSFMSYF